MAAPSTARAASKAVETTAKNFGTSGKVFFGSLCVGTFGLGCWQLERLLEKWDAIEDREHQLGLSPIAYGSSTAVTTAMMDRLVGDDQLRKASAAASSSFDDRLPYRRRLLRGRFHHDKEVLIGPRGAPPGVQMPVSGLSAKNSGKKKTTAASGMQPGPQGFYVYTPMEVVEDVVAVGGGGGPPKTVWINRGWIPKKLVPGADRPHYKNDPVQRAKIDQALREQALAPAWNRPRGTVRIEAILSQPEKPRFITPEHDYSKRPLQLFWIDGLALKAIAAELYTSEDLASGAETAMVTQVIEDGDDDGDESGSGDGPLLYPLQPPVSSIGNFKTTPATHMGYAATWFGLSGAGLFLTRKLITKGRF